MTKLAAVAPAEAPGCPTWLRFLNDATGGDAATVETLRRWSGYCLTGDTREHVLLFVFGPGGNGKSVFLDTLSGILGDYALTAGMETFAASRGERHPTELARLRRARLVTASETEEGRPWAENRIKQLTGGDPITRALHAAG
jgi:putative DNA primase/helicase